ncbi:MAG TPA: glutamate--tRNA ligase [Synergistales bacterium]|nr:glutamate--tRNA ligase [Synergistales bacterium]
MNEKIRVRFAPSPTGALHIGGAHTALFNWLWARRNGGCFVLRIEDTDLARSTAEHEQTILQGMRWLGIEWDEGPDTGGEHGPYRQSERIAIYREHAERLLISGQAYRDGEAIIFSVPHGRTVAFDDAVYGHIEMASETLKDIVLIKSDGFPTYNFAVVVDDHTMDISHVIRGEDHISNTPKQILLYQALGWNIPVFAHLPMILGKDKKKLSKRHGATSVYEYREMGYHPDAIFNYFALLGWNPGDDREIFTREEAVGMFDLSRVTKKAAVFDMDKLNYINQTHISRMPPVERARHVRPFWEEAKLHPVSKSDEWLARALDLLEGRGQTFKELAEYTDYLLSFEPVKNRYDASELNEEQRETLERFFAAMFELPEWNPEILEVKAKTWCEENSTKLKDVAMPLRWAITGRKVSPGIFHIVVFLGRDEVEKRLKYYGLLQ